MVKVAVSGCVHGEIDKLYECLENVENQKGVKADVLLCTGDFQAVRDENDLRSLVCPAKYRQMGDFHAYFTGQKVAKVLTIIIGGNHESIRYMHQAPLGGWIAPNMYYMGRAGVIKYGSLRIAGISGIYNRHEFDEYLPKFANTVSDFNSIYKIRRSDYSVLSQISTPDIILSHDWPQGIYHYGDTQTLLRKKKFLTESVNDGTLGNPYHAELMQNLRPPYWFASHMHVKFEANMNGTYFLALDKNIRPEQFVEILDIPGTVGKIKQDPEWVALNGIHPKAQFGNFFKKKSKERDFIRP